MSTKPENSKQGGGNDVSKLFARFGQGQSASYHDFEPLELPPEHRPQPQSQSQPQAEPELVVESPLSPKSVEQPVPEPTPVAAPQQPQVVPKAETPSQPTPLQQMFQRLLREGAEAPADNDVLRRLLSR